LGEENLSFVVAETPGNSRFSRGGFPENKKGWGIFGKEGGSELR